LPDQSVQKSYFKLWDGVNIRDQVTDHQLHEVTHARRRLDSVEIRIGLSQPRLVTPVRQCGDTGR
jgi:hypothetical protein